MDAELRERSGAIRAYRGEPCENHDALARQGIRTLGKGNGQKVNFGKAEREAGQGREHIARFHPLRSIAHTTR